MMGEERAKERGRNAALEGFHQRCKGAQQQLQQQQPQQPQAMDVDTGASLDLYCS
jgi:hypothetical protein